LGSIRVAPCRSTKPLRSLMIRKSSVDLEMNILSTSLEFLRVLRTSECVGEPNSWKQKLLERFTDLPYQRFYGGIPHLTRCKPTFY
jgi:hypothetical protein